MFITLAQKQEMNIDCFGISVTTMEEVFLQVGKNADASLKRRQAKTPIFMCFEFILRLERRRSEYELNLPLSPLSLEPRLEVIEETEDESKRYCDLNYYFFNTFIELHAYFNNLKNKIQKADLILF